MPIIKNKTGSIGSKDNYRPIALASAMSKVLENVIMSRIQEALFTSANQFGFKKRHATDQCIFVLKEMIESYKVMDASVFVCFLDASKAFDRVNHDKLFMKLHARGVPYYILRIIIFWYETQHMCVRWGSVLSDSFKVTNGVRQGGILSPFFFNIYCDDLSMQLNKCITGCCVSNSIINHLFYADDLALLSPSVRGMNALLRICEMFGIENDILYNPKKTVMMIFRSRALRNAILPEFELYGNTIREVTEYKYLGCYITHDLSDDKDIDRQRRKLYIAGNTLFRKFNMCSIAVKVRLFKAFCTPMYCPYLWCNYKKSSMNHLTIAYHNVCKMFLGYSKFESNSIVCSVFNVLSCSAVIRKLTYKFICRIELSSNELLCTVRDSVLSYTSGLRRLWMNSLYVHFNM